MKSPTKWNVSGISRHLNVNDCIVNYIGPGKKWLDSAMIRTDHPIPQCELFYFEVNIINGGEDGIIGIGFCTKESKLDTMPGWGNNSWGYRGDNEKLFCHSGSGKPYGPLFTTGDTIGCCLNFRSNINIELYPCIGLRSRNGSVEINFGHQNFSYKTFTDYDIEDEILKNNLNRVFDMRNYESLSKQKDILTKLLKSLEAKSIYRTKIYFIIGKCDECLYPDSGLNKDDALTLRYQGEALYMMGCYVRSLKTFEKLLKIKSNDVWALKACEEVRREQMQDELGMEMFYYMKQNCPEEDEEKEERVKEIKKIMNINEKIMEDKQIEKLIDSFLTKGIQNFKISEYMGNVNKDNESLMDRLMLMMQKPIILFAWKIQLIIKNLAKEEKKNLEKILKMSLENLFELCHDGRCKEKLNEKIENFDDFIYYESDFFKRILNIREDEDGNYNILISTRKEIIEKRVKCFSRRRRDNGLRDHIYGICDSCNQYNTYQAWCRTCDPDIEAQKWSSENKCIDNCIKEFQRKAAAYEDIVEWIPFDQLVDIKMIGKGGHSIVFSALWSDGIRITKYEDGNYVKLRKQSSIVALKTLSSDKKNSLIEFENHMKCRLIGSGLKIYGLTKRASDDIYMMVFQYANEGSLSKYLVNNFKEFTWENKLQQLEYISADLAQIHKSGYIHSDLHSGNILLHNNISYITDLGSSRKKDEQIFEGIIYGIVPYVAPEVLSGQQPSQPADIYGLGAIMSEIASGKKPFDGYEHDLTLAYHICDGLLPKFVQETPECYIKLTMRCMDSDPQSRPNAIDVFSEIHQWKQILKSNKDNEIKSQFLKANKIIKTLQVNSPKSPNPIYVSRRINTHEIRNNIASRSIKFNIPD